MPEVDRLVEGAARWLAGRHTRRSFLGKLGRGAVLVAGGSTLASVLTAQEAEARVCGQSGVSPKCDTYDCGDVWGWCWYASGCCAGGELKKICDCCRAHHPNVHGYCPSGTNVLCIVESCGNDPRVQTVSLRQVATDDAIAASALASRARFAPGEARKVWLVDASQPLVAAVMAPAAASDQSPLLLTAANGLAAHTIAELQRLGTRTVALAGPGLSASLDAALRQYGLTVERFESDGDIGVISERIAADLFAAGARRAVCIEPAGMSLLASAIGGALAAAKRYPVIVGVDRAKAFAAAPAANRPVLTYLFGPEAAARAGEVPGGHPFHSGSWDSLSAEVFTAALRAEHADGRAVLLAVGSAPAHAALTFGGPILVHPPQTLDNVRDALFATRDRLRTIGLVGATNALSTQSYYELQSIVNGFEAHKLIGVSGQGLPVIEQPLSERPLGLARRSAAPRVQAESRYWTDRVRDLGS